MRPVDKAFIHGVMFQLGIVPIEEPGLDMRMPLKELTPEDARVLKRKFRKLWRKYMKELAKSENHPGRAKVRYGMGKPVPSRKERLERKTLVYNRVWEEYIVPMLNKFESPDNKKTPVGDKTDEQE